MMHELPIANAAAMLSEAGGQLSLVGGIALVLGGVRLWGARRTRAALVLMVGLLCFGLGMASRSMERLALVELNYYPGWKADMERVLGEDHADFEYSEEDLETDSGEPRWWEGFSWWGQRLAIMIGAVMAGTGFVLEGRVLLFEGKPKRQTKSKRAARP